MNSEEFNNWLKIELLLEKASECLRTMFEQRWKLKYNVEWDNTPECGQSFTSDVGSSVYKTAQRIQKNLLKGGDTRKWDLTIFKSIFTKTDLNKDKTFQAKLKTLVSIRNIIAHRSDKKITNQQYQQYWTDLKDILLFLGVTDDELDDILHSHSSGSKLYVLNKNVQKAVELKQEGNDLLKKQNFKEAITKYTDAIVLPGIPDQDLSILHSNRSFCYLKLGKYAEALEDAKMSKNLNPDYTKAYVRLGRAYMALEKYDKAIKNFDKALGLDTNNEEIQQMRSEARRLKGLKERHNDECLKETYEKNRQNLRDMKGWDKLKRVWIQLEPAKEHIWDGHDYLHKKDYSRAAECYRRAADMRNPEGMYNLALLMMEGKGVTKDFMQAFKLLKEAAQFDPFDKYNMTVVGVKEAEHSIALAYQEGTLTEKDCNMAVLWYERAISHRNGSSANNLALMYLNGDGVVKDLQKAEKLFLCAMNYGDPNAMDNLVDLYMESGNLSKAEEWNKKCIMQGSRNAFFRERKIAQMLLKFNTEHSDLINWEKENNLPVENLTIQERISRKLSSEYPDLSEELEVLNDLQGIYNKSAMLRKPGTKLADGYRFDLEVLAKRKYKSVFSSRMYFAVLRFRQAMETYLKIANRSIAVLDSDSRSFIGQLAECYKLEHFVGTMPIDIHEKVREQVLQLLAESDHAIERCNNDDELAFNQDCRVCYTILNMQSDEIIDFLTECIKKYPDNTFFLEIRGCMYNFEGKRELALRDYIRVEEISENDVEILYHKAATLRLMGQNDRAIDAYKKFLSVASVDHRKVPEAYYSLATCYVAKIETDGIDPDMDSITKYYEQGLNAEKEQIPFFLPYQSTNKEILEVALRVTGRSSKVKEKPVVKPFNFLRKELIVNHRRCIKDFTGLMNMGGVRFNTSAKPSKTQSAPMSLVGLKPTYLNEIDPTSDHVLHGYVLELTLITEPLDNSMSISFVAEDSNSDVQRVSLYNFDKIHLLAIGAKISIIKPYLRIAADGKPLIRVDDPKSVFVSPHRIVDMCHYCGKAHSRYSCSKCKKSKYCSKECQILDWKEYSHKLVCVA